MNIFPDDFDDESPLPGLVVFAIAVCAVAVLALLAFGIHDIFFKP